MEPITDAGDQKNGNSGTGSMLVNFFEAHNVGHVIEALHYCLGHHKANPGSRLSVLHNASAPPESPGFARLWRRFIRSNYRVTRKVPRACPRQTAWLRYKMCPRNGITWWTTPAGAWRLIYGRFPGMLVTTRPPTGTFHDEVMLP